MFYVNKDLYFQMFDKHYNRTTEELILDPQGYPILHGINATRRMYNKYVPVDVPPEELFEVKFVIVFRSVHSNLVAVKNDSFLVPVSLCEGEFSAEATLDDLLLLHGKKFIDSYVQSSNIAEVISHTHIQPWGVVLKENTLYVPVEIIAEDEVFLSGDCALNGDFSDDERDPSEIKLTNGLNPIVDVKNHLVQDDLCKCLEHKLREVK